MVIAINIVALVGIEVAGGIVEEQLYADGVVFVKLEVALVLFVEAVDGIGQVNDNLQAA